MDVRKLATDDSTESLQTRQGRTRTRRQRRSVPTLQGNPGGGGEANCGKVLRSHTRRNTEKTAATEWVSSRCRDPHDHPDQRSLSTTRQCGDAKEEHHNDDDDDVDDETERGDDMGGGTAPSSSVISLSSSCSQSSNERKVPPEQAGLGGTSFKMNATIENAPLVQTGSSSSSHKRPTMAEVGRAKKSEQNEASLRQSSPCSEKIAPTSSSSLLLLRVGEAAITQHSKSQSIVDAADDDAGAGSEDHDEIYSTEQRREYSAEECRRGEMSEGNARRSPKESTCSSAHHNQVASETETRSQSSVTEGSTHNNLLSPCATRSFELDEETQEEKKVSREKRGFKTEEDDLATSLKKLVCVGDGETNKLKGSDRKNSSSNSLGETNSELAGSSSGESSTGLGGEASRSFRNDDDISEEWQGTVKQCDHDEEEIEEPNLLEKEKSRLVRSTSHRTTSTMIQGGVEATPGTEAPYSLSTQRTLSSSSPRSPHESVRGSPTTSPKKKTSGSGSGKKRSFSDQNPAFFKFKKPPQNKKNSLTEGGEKCAKSDNVVSSETTPAGELRRSTVEPRKAQMTSAQMSNLPYMGELTFDTRPRRGRKPKKADICHLISKNYGIYFPSASIDPNLSQEPQRPFPNVESAPVVTKTRFEQGPKARQVGRGGGSSSSVHQNVARCSPAASSRPVLLSPTVPAFYNRDVSIIPIIPSAAWNATGKSTDKSGDRNPSRQGVTDVLSTHPLSFSLHPGLSSGPNSKETISMFPLNPPVREEKGIGRGGKMAVTSRRTTDDGNNSDGTGGMEVDHDNECAFTAKGSDERDQDVPLNLCLRDDTGGKGFLPFPPSTATDMDVRWRKCIEMRLNPDRLTVSSEFGGVPGSNSPTVTIIPGGNRQFSPMKNLGSGAYARKTVANSSPANLVSSGRNLARSSNISTSRISSNSLHALGSAQSHIHSPEISVSIKSSSPDDIGSMAYSHRIDRQLVTGIKEENLGSAKQAPAKRKKDLTTRPSLNSSVCSSSPSAGSYSGIPSPSPTTLSSLGGRLFGQSSGGINDGAEVSICKFKFTGGAKPSLQEKKMLSVDSGGNFRFYTDKANNGITTTKLCKGHQFAVSSSSMKARPSESATSSGKRGLSTEVSIRPETSTFSINIMDSSSGKSSTQSGSHEAGEPKSKSRKGSISISSSSSATGKAGSKKVFSSTPSNSWSTTTPGPLQTDTFTVMPTREEKKMIRLSMEGDQGATTSSCTSTLQYNAAGEDTNSSSNTCSSSDDSNESSKERGKGFELLPSDRNDPDLFRLSQKHFQKHRGSPDKLKMRGKRRTRKSLMREKLEKTFKEKGFLIQTQQLESAEGATYCKFRQLRKFTRYLFRSWKDYLPDTVKEISDNSAKGQAEKRPDVSSQTNPQAEEHDGPVDEMNFHEGNVSADFPPHHDSQEEEIDVEEDDDAGEDEDGDEEMIQ